MRRLVLVVTGLFLLSGLFPGCTSDQDTVKEAENEVFDIHDEVMPKAGQIMKLQKQLKQRISSLDSLKASGSAATDLRSGEDKEQALRLSRDLTIADSLMMAWMTHYNGDTLAKLSSEEALKYLAAQKDQISDVKTRINTSIEQAKQFLGKN
ncbi:BAR domain-containing protein [Spirosoma koreense]